MAKWFALVAVIGPVLFPIAAIGLPCAFFAWGLDRYKEAGSEWRQDAGVLVAIAGTVISAVLLWVPAAYRQYQCSQLTHTLANGVSTVNFSDVAEYKDLKCGTWGDDSESSPARGLRPT